MKDFRWVLFSLKYLDDELIKNLECVTSKLTERLGKSHDELEKSLELKNKVNTVNMIIDVYSTIKELDIISKDVKISMDTNDDIRFNYSAKNTYIRLASIIDGCVSLINIGYGLGLEGLNCNLNNIKINLKKKNIKSKSLDILKDFKNKRYKDIMERNDIIHKCLLNGDLWDLQYLSFMLSNNINFEKNNEIIFEEIKDNYLEILTKDTKTINDFYINFINAYIEEINL